MKLLQRSGDGSVVINPWIFGDADDGGGFKAGWHMAFCQ